MIRKKKQTDTKTTRNKTTQRKKKLKTKKPRLFFAKLLQKYRFGEKMFKYEEEKLKKFLIQKLDSMFSQIVRARDCAGGTVKCASEGSCSSCPTRVTYGTSCAAHRVDRGYWNYRRDFRNVYATCSGCNDPSYDAMFHKLALQQKIESLYGREVRVHMSETRSKKKPRLDELVQLYDTILPTREKIPVDWKG